MPLYNYKCKSCGHEFDKLLSLSRKDEPKQNPCPKCGEVSVQEHITGIGSMQFNDVKPSSEFNSVLKHIHDIHKVPELPK